MNNYFSEVRRHLSAIPEDDVSDMLQFYEEYFYDAGMTDYEAEAKYGNPKKFVQVLKMTYYLDQDDASLSKTKDHKTTGRWHLIWMIILGLFASPILVPLAIAAAAVIFAVLISVLAVIISVYAVVIALIGGGVVSIVIGFAVITQSFSSALTALGTGLFSLGLGCIAAPFLLIFSRWLFELFIKFIKWIGRKLSGRDTRKEIRQEFQDEII